MRHHKDRRANASPGKLINPPHHGEPNSIRQVAVRSEHGYFSEYRFDTNAPICVLRSTDLDTGSMRVIGTVGVLWQMM